MIPKILTAFISAAILSAVLGTLPCKANGAKPHAKLKATTTGTRATGVADLNSPAMDFSGVRPVVDNPRSDLIRPSKDKNQFFDQTIR